MRHWQNKTTGAIDSWEGPDTGRGEAWREVIPVVVGGMEYALLMAARGNDVRHKGWAGQMIVPDLSKLPDDGWYLLPPSPPPLRRGDRVKWWRGEDSGTGTWYEQGKYVPCHQVGIGGMGVFYVERVERIEGGEAS